MIWNYVLGSSIALIILIILVILIYSILNYRSVKKRRKYFEDLHKSITIGSEVIFSNGIYGKVRKIQDDYLEIEVKSGAVLKVSRYAVSEIIK
ncbi:preprotein translocase subunit YajC [Miniphocaeibacter halophilus]|uniref:Preprotein translocase subunit YajC n=1 Tax=Miniphocaeibacter halophilus TaxID=2931922 RepID=A0AC61MPF4_9FIRM|nr:preprotein translocase subunit YajC [Miniphocaeibacter halophilus]QQK07018.1 preprotein translocase subunit YajC [Miniphocaeibacter halophilus]